MAESHTDLSKVFSTLRDDTFSKTFPIDGKVFLLSLSGGADSVFLFHFINYLKTNYSCSFRAIHFNHQLRDDESNGDEAFCKELCSLNEVHLDIYNLDLQSSGNLQDDARAARYKILKQHMTEEDSYLLTAHHASDSIESMLIGFHQGRLDSRLLSLQVIQEAHRILRPLVNLKKESIVELLDSNNLEYRVDSSNTNIKYLRNYYRHSGFNIMTNELGRMQSYFTSMEQSKKELFRAIPCSFDHGVTLICKVDLKHMSHALKIEYFYYLHQEFHASFMKKLDMKRIDLLLSKNRFGKKTFHVSTFQNKQLNVIEYSKKYEIVSV